MRRKKRRREALNALKAKMTSNLKSIFIFEITIRHKSCCDLKILSINNQYFITNDTKM